MQQLKEVIVLTASYYGRQITPELLRMFIDDLSDLPVDEVIAGYQTYRRNPKNVHFPMPAQIRAIVRPEIDVDSAAREIAARIGGAVAKYGWCNAKEARAFIGETGWRLVERSGGWTYICEHHGTSINPSAFQAQIRDLAKGELQFPSPMMNAAIGASPEAGVVRGLVETISRARALPGKVEGES